MRRKTFLNRLAYGTGAALVLPSAGLLQGCEYEPTLRTALTEADLPLLNEIAETILPATDGLPGAKAAGVGEYVLVMYEDCLSARDREILLAGINEIDSRSAKSLSESFLDTEGPEKLWLMESLQSEAITHNLKREGGQDGVGDHSGDGPKAVHPVAEEYPEGDSPRIDELGPHYFDILKGLVVSGYFTSEIGMTQAREYLPVPGKFEACLPYGENDKVWAT